MAKISLIELAKIFLKIGIFSSGGPYAHISLFEDELINNKKLISQASLASMTLPNTGNNSNNAMKGFLIACKLENV